MGYIRKKYKKLPSFLLISAVVAKDRVLEHISSSLAARPSSRGTFLLPKWIPKISGFVNILGSMTGPALSYVTRLRSVRDGTIRSGFFGRFQRAARKSGALRSALRFILRRGVLAPNEIRTVAGAPRTARPRFRDVIALTLELKKS
jgi:hypothetical protein